MATLQTRNVSWVATATRSLDQPAVQLLEPLSGWASARPSGALLTLDGDDGAVFRVDEGSIRAAYELRRGRLQDTGRRMSRFVDRFGWSRFAVDAHRPDPGAFWALGHMCITEALLEHLERSSTVAFVRGSLAWTGPCLPRSEAPGLTPAIMELARRSDELPRLRPRLGEPGRRLRRGPPPNASARHAASPTAEDPDALDFILDPDPEAEDEWLDARHVYRACAAPMTLDQLVEQAGLGRFRALSAVAMLLARGHLRQEARPAVNRSAPHESVQQVA